MEALLKEIADKFIEAKADGKLDIAEVITIALFVSQQVQKVQALSGAEKKSFVLSALRKGLHAAGGFPQPGVEDLLLQAAGAAIDGAVAAAQGKIDLRKKEGWVSCLGLCAGVAQTAVGLAISSQEVAALAQAVKAVAPAVAPVAAALELREAVAAAAAPAPAPPVEVPSPESVSVPEPTHLEPIPEAASNTPLSTESETAPNPAPQEKESPPPLQVSFD